MCVLDGLVTQKLAVGGHHCVRTLGRLPGLHLQITKAITTNYYVDKLSWRDSHANVKDDDFAFDHFL